MTPEREGLLKQLGYVKLVEPLIKRENVFTWVLVKDGSIHWYGSDEFLSRATVEQLIRIANRNANRQKQVEVTVEAPGGCADIALLFSLFAFAISVIKLLV